MRPPVKAHISVLLALIALDKAAGYVLQRWSLVNASDGYVNGAGYTDVHARLPAELLLVYVSIFAAGILLFNIRRQGWTLPVLAVGIWAFVALVVGIIYPALLQALKVNPAQSSLEAPYIQRNITATRAAYNLNDVNVKQFPASTNISPSQAVLNTPTINNIRQWDPDPSISLQTFQRLQGIKSYYTFASLGVDRYSLGGAFTPVLVGVREISPTGLVSQTWVNTHLQYTHGNGAAIALANQTSNNNPVFGVGGVPPSSSMGLPQIKQPYSGVYFGLGESGYVIANTKQLEVDYQQTNGNNVESHYSGTGGVQLSSLFTRAMFALRLGDFNLLISSQITDKSRIMFVRDPVAMAAEGGALPQLRPRPVRGDQQGPHRLGRRRLHDDVQLPLLAERELAAGGHREHPAGQLQLRAQLGQGRHRRVFGEDDLLRHRPVGPDPAGVLGGVPAHVRAGRRTCRRLKAHLRYPEDIFSIQSAIYGRYHLTNPAAFYSASSAWQLSPTAGAGPQSQALLAENTYNNQGQLVSTTPARMAPQYQVYSLPNTPPQDQIFTITNGFVPAAQSSLANNTQNFNLTAFMVGQSDPGDYGRLTLYQTPQGTIGPANADAEISANNTVSSDITLLDQHQSEVLLGETLMVPIGNSMVYLRPLYVAATTNPQPQLEYVVAVLGKTVKIDTSLTSVLSDITNVALPTSSSGSGTGTVPAAVSNILSQAQTDYSNAQTALAQGNLAQYQQDIKMMQQAIASAQAVLPTTTSTPTTTTTTAPPKPKPGKTTTKKASTGGTSSTSTTAAPASTTTTTPTSTEPGSRSTTTSTTVASAAGVPGGGC